MANSSTTFATGEAGNFSFTPPRSTPPQSLHSSADPFVFGFGSQDNKIGSEKRSIDKVKSPRYELANSTNFLNIFFPTKERYQTN